VLFGGGGGGVMFFPLSDPFNPDDSVCVCVCVCVQTSDDVEPRDIIFIHSRTHEHKLN